MKKIFCFLILILCAGFFGCVKAEPKHECQIDSDCAVSYNDPDGFETCVNAEWLKGHDSNLEYQCKRTEGLSCRCVSGVCQRSDGQEKTGC